MRKILGALAAREFAVPAETALNPATTIPPIP
jgi:hypothetical protein